jgi:3'-phosphoadenosine 5'-phosphosulfate (PAPS) 3'-phosphatase
MTDSPHAAFPAPDIDQVAAIIRETAAEEVLPRFRELAAHDIHEKAPGDLVTTADLAVERVLTRRLAELVPGSAVVGEEAVHHDPARPIFPKATRCSSSRSPMSAAGGLAHPGSTIRCATSP